MLPDTGADRGIVALAFAETVSPGDHEVKLTCSLTGGAATAGLSAVAVGE